MPKEQEVNSNSKSKMKKITTDVSTPKKNKQVVKAVGDSGTNNCSTSKNRTDSNTNCKRKFEALTKVATYAEHVDGQSPTKYLQASESIDLIVLRYFDFTDPLLFLLIITSTMPVLTLWQHLNMQMKTTKRHSLLHKTWHLQLSKLPLTTKHPRCK